MILRELIKGGFGIMMFQKCQVCGFLPFDGKSDTDNSMVNVFSGSVKVKVKVKVKLNMVRVTSNHSMVNVFSGE